MLQLNESPSWGKDQGVLLQATVPPTPAGSPDVPGGSGVLVVSQGKELPETRMEDVALWYG